MNVKDLGHWTDKRKKDEDLHAPVSGRKNAGNVGLEIMRLISGRKICRQFWVRKYAGNFGLEDMPQFRVGRYVGDFELKKNAGNVSKFGPGKKCWCFREGIRLPENLQV